MKVLRNPGIFISLIAGTFGLGFSQAQADESGIVPKAFHVIPVTIESSLSPDEAAVHFTRDGKGVFERARRSAFPFISPLENQKAPIASGYGESEESPTGKGGFHPGLDFLAEAGTSVRASAAGKVVRTGYTAGYGIHLVIDHGIFSSLYAHLSPKPPVKRGDKVEAGQIIGAVGETGQCRQPLLHYELFLSASRQGKLYSVDPGIFITLGTRAGKAGSAATLAYGFVPLSPVFKKEKAAFETRFDVDGTVVSIKEPEEEQPFLHPLGNSKLKIDTGFGIRTSPFTGKKEFHAGVDIVTPYGSRVLSPANGICAKIGFEAGYGSYIILRHGDIATLYSHLDGKPLVAEGQKLIRGQAVGRTGKTGRSTGPHLHYEVRYVPDQKSDFKEAIKYLFDPEDFLSYGD